VPNFTTSSLNLISNFCGLITVISVTSGALPSLSPLVSEIDAGFGDKRLLFQSTAPTNFNSISLLDLT
jgi:hypothetical protein